MKSFPSIPYYQEYIGNHIIAFDKLDGSNIRFEWTKKRGWYKFGTRKMMIDESHPEFGESVVLFKEKYADDLEKIFKKNKNYRNARSMVAYVEYLGENSFAGYHDPDDKKDVVLIGIDQFQKRFPHPRQFVKDFGHLHIPDIIYKGVLDMNFINAVKMNEFGLKEGVVCKGVDNNEHFMCKIKTLEWLKVIKERLGTEFVMEDLNYDSNMFEEL